MDTFLLPWKQVKWKRYKYYTIKEEKIKNRFNIFHGIKSNEFLIDNE